MTISTVFLCAALACLISAPWLHGRIRAAWPRYESAADRGLPWVIVALVLVELFRLAHDAGGLLIVGSAVLGWAIPGALEQAFRRRTNEVHLATLALAVAGLLAHGFADGAIIRSDSDAWHLLSVAIAVHSLPVGVAIWWLIAPQLGSGLAGGTIAAVCAATVAGFFSGAALHDHAGDGVWVLIEAFVAGSLVHVAFGKPHLEHGGSHRH